ncbi:MAG: orotidine-5'-phosphate decarboxylase [Gracilibacteraceae bacterium]|jgi:orotidine-5'-phosphate decarboxylase|nr:orotidine-5'-phosphate decarboxylase [Gracilibacteraceae bacterium]
MTRNMAEKVIVALDFDRPEAALATASCLRGAGCRLKVGLELYARAGLEFVGRLTEQGFSVFLDLKLHDIPTTVEKTLRRLVDSEATLFDVHCLGGLEMMTRAAELCHGAGKKLLGVTMLTSMGEEGMKAVGIGGAMEEQVLRLAELAWRAGLDGVVASPWEAAALRREFGEDFLIVTPGIRPAGSAANDQARAMTPAAALRAGSSLLVVGRPVTGAADPRAALERLWD